MPSSLASVFALSVLALAVGCTDDPGVPPLSPLTPPIEGTWRITRTVPSQPTDCAVLTANAIDVTFAPGAAQPIAMQSSTSLRDYDQVVSDDTAGFVTEDFGFFDVPGRPVLISHQLRVDGAGLVGTGRARGDGDDLGCTWDLVLDAIRIP